MQTIVSFPVSTLQFFFFYSPALKTETNKNFNKFVLTSWRDGCDSSNLRLEPGYGNVFQKHSGGGSEPRSQACAIFGYTKAVTEPGI